MTNKYMYFVANWKMFGDLRTLNTLNKVIAFTKKITENDIKKENFIYSFLSSVRQKMLIKKK